VRDVHELARAEEKLATGIRVRLQVAEVTRDRLLALRGVLDQHPGMCAVTLHLLIPGESETVVALPEARGVRPSEQLHADLAGLFGRSVTEVAT
jgi:hypothetical protein